MRFSTKPLSLIVALVIGAFIGMLGGPAIVLVLWGLVGLAVGTLSMTKKAAATNGAIYGFALAYVFMLAGYNGDAALSTRILPFVVFGVFGAVCGGVLAVIGFVARRFWVDKA